MSLERFSSKDQEIIRKRFPNRIEGVIEAENVELGVGVVIEKGVIIKGYRGQKAKSVRIGNFTYIGNDTKVFAPVFELGDYTKWNERGFGSGENPLKIGRNCWLGGGVILDPMGGMEIHDGVGVGAGSQLWSHIQFGDISQGCKYFSHKKSTIKDDVWFVGHCLVSPIVAEKRSMALLGSVVTKNMRENHVYAGVPAVETGGVQFGEISDEAKAGIMWGLIREFEDKHPEHRGKLSVSIGPDGNNDNGKTNFDIKARTYTQRYSQAEVAFLKSKVPLIKYNPAGEESFITPDEGQ